jgi:4,5-dihydroxyphthalate decarboxylase
MAFPANGPVKLRTNLADNPNTLGMKDGRLTSELVTFDFCGPKTAHDGFKAMLREHAFDAGELAIATYLQARVYGKPFVLLPTPMSGRLQHHNIGFNVEHGELRPKDIEGRMVGVRTYAQTTGLWVRGILQHEYGVDLDKVTWLTVDESHLLEYEDPPNCRRIPKGKGIDQMMLDGEIAAAILGADMPKDPRVRTLVPNALEAGNQWYQRGGVMPINHMFVVHEELSRQRPDVVRELGRLIRESRDLAPPAVTAALPPLGLEACRKGLEMAIEWSFEQKIIPRRLKVDELFDDTTANLKV